MNLHSIVSPYIGAVNPLLQVSIRLSAGFTQDASFRQIPAYETPGSFTGTISGGNVLVVSAVTAGKLKPGQTIAGAGVDAGSMIVEQVSGTPGGIGVYELSNSQADVGSEVMTTALTLLAQVQPLSSKDLRQLEGINLNGDVRAIYLNGDLNGVVRVALKGGDLITLVRDGTVWLVNQQLEGWNASAGWTKAAMTLQNGA